MLKFIDTYNLDDLMLTESPNKAACVLLLVMSEINNGKLYEKLMRDGNTENQLTLKCTARSA